MFLGIEQEYFRGQFDVRVDTDSTGEEFLEDGRVPADEIDGAGGDAEGLSLLGDEREWEGL